ncbi:Endonuclease/exonuclease/phosphatase [Daldinia decipiens]|uniref:Endonuclease/exonuclease/phosphatase n=1 Tax=Daldinia decipiens TaxID=326647 RepID=UPI0020C511A2|nr:Endonuclease/exonuclease/phosphatase [Daldinia decipiens]KAI1660350.1 Endonuclease/exonuclease/phosphatase [Daldinia decipiens]
MKIPKSVQDMYRRRSRIMEELIKKALEENGATRRPFDAVPWKPDQPYAQPFFTHDRSKQAWTPANPKPLQEGGSGSGINRLRLYSWNIDFMLPFAKARMSAALDHLNGLTSNLPSTTASVIFLQECIEEDLETIGENEWVRDKFNVTDTDGSNWQTHYGTTTLVDRRLDITACFRVHYAQTQMGRDALVVETALDAPGSGAPKTLRLCNSHLESLARKPPLRPAQVRVLAAQMRAPGVHVALAAGDFNAIQPFDRTLHADNGLKDAYLELGGREDSDAGYTWGQQAATKTRARFGCSRMDKVYFTGGLEVRGFERFGAGVQFSGERERREMEELGFEKPWITDHLGVVVEVEVVD